MATFEKRFFTDVDQQFLKSHLTQNHGPYSLMAVSWNKCDYGGKTHERLVVFTKIHFLLVKTKTFGSKRAIDKTLMWTDLKSAKLRTLNSIYEITLVFSSRASGKEEFHILPEKEDAEKFAQELYANLARIKNGLPKGAWRDPDIDCAPEMMPKDTEFKPMSPGAKVQFCYALHCALAGITQQDAILQNLITTVESGTNEFLPYDILRGAKERRNHLNVIVNSVSTLDCFTVLRVDGQPCRPDFLREMGKLILVNSVFKEVEFPNCGIDGKQLQKFCGVFSELKKSTGRSRSPLRLLNLMKNPLGNFGEAMDGLKELKVELLVLSDCKISNKSKSIGALTRLLTHDSWLAVDGVRVLNLSHNPIGTKGGQTLLEFLDKTKGLEELGLVGTGVDLTQCLKALAKNDNISKDKFCALNISQNKMTPYGSVALGELLAGSAKMRRVVMRNCTLDENALEEIFKGIGKNTSGAEIDLDLSENRLDKIVGPVFRGTKDFGPALAGLNLRNCYIEKEMKDIAKSLETAKNLKSLILDLNFRSNKKGSHLDAMQALAATVSKLTKLELLSILGDKKNAKLSLTGVELEPTLKAVCSSPSMRVLNVVGNRLGDEGFKTLAEGLKGANLTFLDVEDNKMTWQNFVTLKEAVETSGCKLQGRLPKQSIYRLFNEAKKKKRPLVTETANALKELLKKNADAAAQQATQDALPLPDERPKAMSIASEASDGECRPRGLSSHMARPGRSSIFQPSFVDDEALTNAQDEDEFDLKRALSEEEVKAEEKEPQPAPETQEGHPGLVPPGVDANTTRYSGVLNGALGQKPIVKPGLSHGGYSSVVYEKRASMLNEQPRLGDAVARNEGETRFSSIGNDLETAGYSMRMENVPSDIISPTKSMKSPSIHEIREDDIYSPKAGIAPDVSELSEPRQSRGSRKGGIQLLLKQQGMNQGSLAMEALAKRKKLKNRSSNPRTPKKTPGGPAASDPEASVAPPPPSGVEPAKPRSIPKLKAQLSASRKSSKTPTPGGPESTPGGPGAPEETDKAATDAPAEAPPADEAKSGGEDEKTKPPEPVADQEKSKPPTPKPEQAEASGDPAPAGEGEAEAAKQSEPDSKPAEADAKPSEDSDPKKEEEPTPKKKSPNKKSVKLPKSKPGVKHAKSSVLPAGKKPKKKKGKGKKERGRIGGKRKKNALAAKFEGMAVMGAKRPPPRKSAPPKKLGAAFKSMPLPGIGPPPTRKSKSQGFDSTTAPMEEAKEEESKPDLADIQKAKPVIGGRRRRARRQRKS